MLVEELRIGNFIQHKIHKLSFPVESLMKDQCFNDYRAIPLTEEWLKKLGFEKTTYKSNHPDYCDEICYELEHEEFFLQFADDFSLVIYESKETQEKELGIVPDWRIIQYVHQLQNLYFALTGEELTINEI